MRAAIFNPYLDTLGGGERYTLSFAKVLHDAGYEVDVVWKSPEILHTSETRFGLNLSGIEIVDDIKRGDGYDLCFWVSDGSIPTLRSRKNILHFQFPFKNVNGRSLLNKMKLFRINKIICNSEFTKNIIDAEYGLDSVVIYPPVDTESIVSKRKENVILNVGRFSQLTQSKRQDLLIDVFKIFHTTHPDWKLILAGGTEIGVDEYFHNLKMNSAGYPIEIIESPDFATLKGLYGKAKIYWSAVGYGVDLEKNPTKVEHFGMNVVEAMAGGSVPLAYKSGGHTEIIQNTINGFLWTKKDELLEITKSLANKKVSIREMSQNAKARSAIFSLDKFSKSIKTAVL